MLQGLYQQNTYREYDHAFRLNPDGDYQRHQTSFLVSGGYTHVFGESSFLDATASVYVSDYKQYVYENPYDSRYVNPERLQDAGANSFLTGGTAELAFQAHHDHGHGAARLHLADHVHPSVEDGCGSAAAHAEVRRLPDPDRCDHRLQAAASAGGEFRLQLHTPTIRYQLAAYIQDKIELEYLVVNAGLRFDYFEPDGMTLVNADSIAALDNMQPPYAGPLFAKAKAKYQVSPRFGISYPITDRGAVHLSYGHFFQIPAFSYLYKNPSFRIPLTGNYPEFVGNTIGNADLEPQRTTMYEIGLQQEIAPTIGVTLTGYYKDIRNLLGLEIHTKNDFKKYGKYVNRNYGSVRGITVSVREDG